MKRLLVGAALSLALAACNDQHASNSRSLAPIPPQTVALMSSKGMSAKDPILVRVFKKESELEVWKRTVEGEYAHLKTYPICRWSGSSARSAARATVRLRRDSTRSRPGR
jgi:murein L,D-transpeptidase YafK